MSIKIMVLGFRMKKSLNKKLSNKLIASRILFFFVNTSTFNPINFSSKYILFPVVCIFTKCNVEKLMVLKVFRWKFWGILILLQFIRSKISIILDKILKQKLVELNIF